MTSAVDRQPRPGGLWYGLLVQFRVLSALFLREGESRRGKGFAFGFVAAALEPLIIIIAISTLFYLLDRQAGYGASLLVFVGTGVFPVYVFIHTSMRIREPLAGTEVGRFPVETSLDHVLIHAILHLISTVTVAFLFFGVVFYVFHDRQAIPCDWVNVIGAIGANFMLGVSMGIFNSVIAKLVPFWNTVWPGISRAAIHFSGMYFVADFLPPVHRKFFAINPILHGVSWFRTGFYPTYPRILDNHNFIIMTSAITMTLGLLLERQFRRVMGEAD
jgi:capsular polysaccharide transport system permease protein